jgi:hypothetical protein
MCGAVGAMSISTYIHFGLRKGLGTEPLRDLEISVFLCAYILKMGWTGHVVGLGEGRMRTGF